jgi:hypothetical protein
MQHCGVPGSDNSTGAIYITQREKAKGKKKSAMTRKLLQN